MTSRKIIFSALFIFLFPLAVCFPADTPLEKRMNQMRKSFRELKKAMEAPVEADKAKAQEYGIGGVPFFVIAERFGIAGAQPPEALLQALEQVHAERQASA